MVVADPATTLLTACEYGYGKRTLFGPGSSVEDAAEDETASNARYRTQRRGGKGLRDIKTTARNGRVIGVVRVDDDDEVIMMTGRGKLQRICARDVSVIGRNTQGVRIMTLDEGDTLAAVVRVPKEESTAEPDLAEADLAEATSPKMHGPPTRLPDADLPEAVDAEGDDSDTPERGHQEPLPDPEPGESGTEEGPSP
jgi:DNA gyrase subunit A